VLIGIGCILLFALMCLVVADVGRRYLFNAPIAWSTR
jgi:TRAP-type C4-dicarboxylate transport system permease small subunit